MALKLNGTNSVAAPAYAGADADTGLQCGTDEVNLVTGGTARLKIDSSGNVGVGTTSPGAKLEVLGGAIRINSPAGGYYFDIERSGTDGALEFKGYQVGYSGFAWKTSDVSDGSFGEKMRLTTGGRLGIGTTSPNGKFVVSNSGAESFEFYPADASNVNKINYYNRSGSVYCDAVQNAASHQFQIQGTEKIRIDSSGRLLVGTTAGAAGRLIHIDGGSSSAYFHSTNTSSGSGASDGLIVGLGSAKDAYIWNYESGFLAFATAGSERMRIDSSGNVGIGPISPDRQLHVKNTTDTAQVKIETTASSGRAQVQYASPNGDWVQGIQGATTSGDFLTYTAGSKNILWFTGASERMRIASNGRVGIGTSSPTTRAHLDGTDNGTDNVLFLSAANLASGAGGKIAFGGNYDGTNRTSWADIKGSKENATSGEYGGYLSLSTRPNGGSNTERVRITSNGAMQMGDPSGSGNGGWLAYVSDPGTANQRGRQLMYAKSGTSGGQEILQIFNGSTEKLRMRADGNVYNVNNTFSSLSDVKLKENIVDAASQWDDIKGLRVRKYNFKESTGHDTHTQIGLVAQEVETVSPGLVTDLAENDADGNQTNIVTKSVNYSVLYMKAVKALQEAQTRIETLETQHADLLARVTALEAA